jgi:hypothetical protein
MTKCLVTENKNRLIDEKTKLLPTQQYGTYLHKMAIDGSIIYADTAGMGGQGNMRPSRKKWSVLKKKERQHEQKDLFSGV